VLDDVERRRFLVDPAREDPPPARIRLLDVELEEGAGELFILPRRGRLAGPKPHDRVLHLDGHARLHPEFADDPVALVEQSNHRNAVFHWRNADLLSGPGACLGKLSPIAFRFVLAALAGSRKKQPQQCAGRC
jgi:hypothetical protein